MNTLKVAKQLQDAGCDSKVAEVISLSINEAVDEKAVTKLDLLEVKSELKQSIGNFKSELKQDISAVQNDLLKTETRLRDYTNKAFLITCGFIAAMNGIIIFLAEWRWFK